MVEINLPQLPKEWAWTTLGEIRLDKSTSVNPIKTPDKLFELYSVPSFEEEKPEIIEGAKIGSNKQAIENETVLLCKINPRINRVWIVGNFSKWEKIASTEWIPFFSISGISPKYLRYFLMNNDFRSFLSLNVSGVGGSLMRVKPSTLAQYPFPLAPVQEQHRIVAKIEELFSDLDSGVEALKKAKAQLRLYRQAVLKAAFAGRLTAGWREAHKGELELATTLLKKEGATTGKKIGPLPNINELGSELPELWVLINLRSCAALITKGESPKWQGFDYVEEGIPFIRSENVLWGKVNLFNPVKIPENFHKKLKRSQLKAGDVLINLVGASIGRCGLLPQFFTAGNINQAVALIRANDALMPSYLMYLLNSPKIQKAIHSSKVETARPNISLGDLNDLIIPLPPIAEQKQIVNEVEHYYTLADHLENDIENNIKQADRLRQSILKQAFTGELVPQDPEDEPAAELLKRIKGEKAMHPAGRRSHAGIKKTEKLW